MNVVVSSFLIIISLILIEWINKASVYDLLIIVAGGIIATFFAGAFATFFCQQAMFPTVKDFRRMLIERGEKMENIQLSGIGSKFYFLFFLPVFTVLIVLIMSFPLNLNAVIISLIGLIMTFIIDRVLYVYLSDSLRELERFANELPRGERAVFATGSLDKEIVSLADNLNNASEEIHSSQKQLGKSQEEMAKRVAELEKFFELTINREVKMIELKKEINKLKGNVQEDDA
jgi:glucan phosphoethanolaminetransferase (alkaline phosphatase superfamily)